MVTRAPTSLERMPPSNLEAEQALLGSILIDPDAIFKAMTVVRPDDMFSERHKWIYDVCIYLQEHHQPIDFVTVTDELERRQQLAEVGGAGYISSLINVVPTAAHVEHYAEIVERTATLRRLIHAATDITGLAYADSGELGEILDQAEQAVFNVSQRRLGRELAPLKRFLDEYYEQIQTLYEQRGQPYGLPTGYSKLDRQLGGLQPSDLIIVAGRPGIGKSSFALNIVHNVATKPPPKVVAVFTLEMAGEQVVQRLVSNMTGVDSQRLRLGQIDDQEHERVLQAIARLNETAIYIDDTPTAAPMEIRSKARRLHAETGLDLIVIDYLQLMRAGVRTENRVQEISYISRALKALARELRVPVIAISQLSREVEKRQDKRPQLSDLRESGALEQDADIVVFVYREDAYKEDTDKRNIAEIIVAKHRHGPTGTIELHYRRDQSRFADLEYYRDVGDVPV